MEANFRRVNKWRGRWEGKKEISIVVKGQSKVLSTVGEWERRFDRSIDRSCVRCSWMGFAKGGEAMDNDEYLSRLSFKCRGMVYKLEKE